MALCIRSSNVLCNSLLLQLMRATSIQSCLVRQHCLFTADANRTESIHLKRKIQLTRNTLPSLTWSIVRAYSKKGKDKGGKGHKKIDLAPEQLEGLVNMEKVNEEFNHVLEDLHEKFIHQVTLRTSIGAFDNLVVKTPEGNFPLIQLGQVLQKSPQLLTIDLATSPQYITNVKEALMGSGMNINPQQDGTSLFVPIPKVTREHRENLSKNAKALSEKSKKQLRDIFSKYSKKIKSSKEGHSADDLQAAEDKVQEMMHQVLHKVEEITAAKQQELLGGK
ncbi:ribosome-recycling factor, mitochondrial-like [Biomphalaria glabrata]|uniref:Ribosome-recycling factor, mitochondrial n=1 Tax=Biomphalaria glabrata TaxID=6526 RepID=A0A9W3BAN8_BIOGL|nr:ribosome-recycling factor, mitochondrial-like [Biomphalaria glabrata]